ncbi:MAG: hypothetical protein AAFN92_06800 [Bacteroidota bacterium]
MFDGLVQTGHGYTAGGLLGYELGDWLFTLRPAYRRQNLRAIIPPRDEVPAGVESLIYRNTVSLSLRTNYFFGRQRFRPVLGFGAGFLLDLTQDMGVSALRPEPVLPYLEISAGVEGSFAGLRWRPEVVLYHGVGEIFAASRGLYNHLLPGKRLAFVSFGVVVIK